MGAMENAMMMMDAFDKFAPWGEQYKQRQQNLQQRQQNLQQGQQNLQQGEQHIAAGQEALGQAGLKGIMDDQQAAVQGASGSMTPELLNEGFKTPLTADQPRFWHELDRGEQEHVRGHFVQHGVNEFGEGAIPGAYDNWVSQQYHVLPSVPMPMGMNMGGADDKSLGVTRRMLPERGTDGKWSMGFKEYPLPLSEGQMQQVENDPVGGFAQFPEAQRKAGQEYGGNIVSSRKDFQEQTKNNSAMARYLGNGGESQGILANWQDARALLDKAGGDYSKLSPNDQRALIFKYGAQLNPGVGVKDWEFEQLAKTGSLPTQVQSHWNQLASGQMLTPEQVKGVYGVMDSIKGTAQKSFESSLSGMEGNLSKHVPLEAVLNRPDVLAEYRKNYGPLVKDPASDPRLAQMKPGAVFHLPDGRIVRKDAAPPVTPPVAAPAAAPALPNLPTQPAPVAPAPAPAPASTSPAPVSLPSLPNLPGVSAPAKASNHSGSNSLGSKAQMEILKQRVSAEQAAERPGRIASLTKELQLAQTPLGKRFMSQRTYAEKSAELQRLTTEEQEAKANTLPLISPFRASLIP